MLRFERVLAHPPEQVFRAISEPAELRHWFPAERRVGAARRARRSASPSRPATRTRPAARCSRSTRRGCCGSPGATTCWPGRSRPRARAAGSCSRTRSRRAACPAGCPAPRATRRAGTCASPPSPPGSTARRPRSRVVPAVRGLRGALRARRGAGDGGRRAVRARRGAAARGGLGAAGRRRGARRSASPRRARFGPEPPGPVVAVEPERSLAYARRRRRASCAGRSSRACPAR